MRTAIFHYLNVYFWLLISVLKKVILQKGDTILAKNWAIVVNFLLPANIVNDLASNSGNSRQTGLGEIGNAILQNSHLNTVHIPLDFDPEVQHPL